MGKRRQNLNRLKEVLAEKGISRSWLAGELDVDFRTVSRWTNGHAQPDLATLFEIARILKIRPRELLND